MKQFNLEEYLANPEREVVTRSGEEVEIISTTGREPFRIIGYVDVHKVPSYWCSNGHFLIDGITTHSYDLFFSDTESEDERIRKDIIAFLQSMNSHCNPTQDWDLRNRWLPYLEKQKEQKPILSDRDSTDFEIEVHEIIAQARKDSRLNDADVLKQFEEEAAFALMLKANKLIWQKPDWSEEDEDFINMLILHFNYLIDKGGDSVETYKSYREKLKSLRPRPHWKPSKEQMDALSSAIANATPQTYAALSKLYNDLKKLMEE